MDPHLGPPSARLDEPELRAGTPTMVHPSARLGEPELRAGTPTVVHPSARLGVPELRAGTPTMVHPSARLGEPELRAGTPTVVHPSARLREPELRPPPSPEHQANPGVPHLSPGTISQPTGASKTPRHWYPVIDLGFGGLGFSLVPSGPRPAGLSPTRGTRAPGREPHRGPPLCPTQRTRAPGMDPHRGPPLRPTRGTRAPAQLGPPPSPAHRPNPGLPHLSPGITVPAHPGLQKTAPLVPRNRLRFWRLRFFPGSLRAEARRPQPDSGNQSSGQGPPTVVRPPTRLGEPEPPPTLVHTQPQAHWFTPRPSPPNPGEGGPARRPTKTWIEGLLSMDRSDGAALPRTKPRPRIRSSTSHLAPGSPQT